jgi:ribosomal protein S18 acetylase RimI-like enzyme
MTDAQYMAYRETAEDDYARQIAESGGMSWEAAVDKAAADFRRLLPDGLHSPGQHLFTAYDDATEVGMLWLRIDDGEAYVLDISVRPDQRRRGYGRAIMEAGEAECRARGVTAIGLNVFGPNVAARALYDQLGYQVTAMQMRKRL